MPLTDEHVVPYALGGKHVLARSSCHRCADITKRFEQDVSRELWGDARASYDAPTRRKKERQSRIVIQHPSNEGEILDVPVEEYPAPMVFYQMGRAGYLRDEVDDKDHSGEWKLVTIVDEPRIQKFQSQQPGKLLARFRHVPMSFARLLAKIGYGQIMTSLDPSDFRPFCLPYILGEKSNLSYIVGGRADIEKPNSGIGYRLSSIRIGTAERVLLLAEIRLIANTHTPTYHVVVGEAVGKSKVEVVKNKLCETYAVQIDENHDYLNKLSKQFHWCPPNWPLPSWPA